MDTEYPCGCDEFCPDSELCLLCLLCNSNEVVPGRVSIERSALGRSAYLPRSAGDPAQRDKISGCLFWVRLRQARQDQRPQCEQGGDLHSNQPARECGDFFPHFTDGPLNAIQAGVGLAVLLNGLFGHAF